MKKSDSIGKLAGALAAFQGAMTTLEKNREVEVKMKSGGNYSFSYTTFDAIVSAVREPLAKNGLSWCQGLDGSANGSVVTTLLMHESGEWIETIVPVRSKGDGAQDLGSGISYAKRYALTAILGIASEDDDDGNVADGNEVIVKPKGTGISAMRPAISLMMGNIDAAQDWDAVSIYINQPESKKIAVTAARDFPDLWNGIKGMDGSGLKGILMTAARQLGKEKEAKDWASKVETAAAKPKETA